MAFNLVRICIISDPLSIAKREISFEVFTFEGSLFSGDRYPWDSLTKYKRYINILLLFYYYIRYFRGVVTFGTSGNC